MEPKINVNCSPIRSFDQQTAGYSIQPKINIHQCGFQFYLHPQTQVYIITVGTNHKYTYIGTSLMHICTHTCTHVHLCVHTHTHYMHTHVYTHARAHTHTHTKLTCTWGRPWGYPWCHGTGPCPAAPSRQLFWHQIASCSEDIRK